MCIFETLYEIFYNDSNVKVNNFTILSFRTETILSFKVCNFKGRVVI